jgi:hypothetical protein
MSINLSDFYDGHYNPPSFNSKSNISVGLKNRHEKDEVQKELEEAERKRKNDNDFLLSNFLLSNLIG